MGKELPGFGELHETSPKLNIPALIEEEGPTLAQVAVRRFDECYPNQKDLEKLIEDGVAVTADDFIERHDVSSIEKVEVKASLEPFIRAILTQVYEATVQHEKGQ